MIQPKLIANRLPWKLYNNNFNVMKPKYLGKVKTLLYFRNTPILVLTESRN